MNKKETTRAKGFKEKFDHFSTWVTKATRKPLRFFNSNAYCNSLGCNRTNI